MNRIVKNKNLLVIQILDHLLRLLKIKFKNKTRDFKNVIIIKIRRHN